MAAEANAMAIKIEPDQPQPEVQAEIMATSIGNIVIIDEPTASNENVTVDVRNAEEFPKDTFEPEVDPSDSLSLPQDVFVEKLKAHPDNVYLIIGKNGWIGGQLAVLLKEAGCKITYLECRMEDRTAVTKSIEETKATHVLLAAGVSHGKVEGEPDNVDYCEDHQMETLRANILGTLTVVDVCMQHNVHCTVFATGCIYDYGEMLGDRERMNIFEGFSEECEPNFTGSYYSKSKFYAETLIKEFMAARKDPRLLVLRVRMPISGDGNKRCLLTKLSSFEKVIDIQNSLSILPELLPAALVMAVANVNGVYNFVNAGTLSHPEILQIKDKNKIAKTFTVEEQNEIIKAARCNNKLNVAKLNQVGRTLGIKISHCKDALSTIVSTLLVKVPVVEADENPRKKMKVDEEIEIENDENKHVQVHA